MPRALTPRPLHIETLLGNSATRALATKLAAVDLKKGNQNGLFEYSEAQFLSARDLANYTRLLGGVAPVAASDGEVEPIGRLIRAEPAKRLGTGRAVAIEYEQKSYPSAFYGQPPVTRRELSRKAREALPTLSDQAIRSLPAIEVGPLTDDLWKADPGLLRFLARTLELDGPGAKSYREPVRRFLQSTIAENDAFCAGKDLGEMVGVLKRLARAAGVDVATIKISLADGSSRTVGLKAFERLDPATYAAPAPRATWALEDGHL